MANSPQAFGKPERRREVDWTRILLVLGLNFFHTARIFDLMPFYVKNEQTSIAMMALVGFASQWGMPLFFFIAGMATNYSLRHRTAGEFVAERCKRLLMPLLFGIVVIVPPQLYYNALTNPDYAESYGQFYPKFFRVVFTLDFPQFIKADPAVGFFETAHLWFLYYLFIFSLLVLPLLVYLKKSSGRDLIARLAAWMKRPFAIFSLALPIILIEVALPVAGVGGWNRYAYIPFLMNGHLFAADKRFSASASQHRLIALVCAVLTLFAFFALSVFTWQAHIDPSRGFALQNILWRFCKAFCAWCWILAIWGFTHSYKTAQDSQTQEDIAPAVTGKDFQPQLAQQKRSTFWDRTLLYANEAALPFYIIHQTPIVLIGFYVVKWQMAMSLKYLIINVASLIVTWLLYDLFVRRMALTRFLFGMKPKNLLPTSPPPRL
jgi:hypothetical protein